MGAARLMLFIMPFSSHYGKLYAQTTRGKFSIVAWALIV
jgi:hypothetical protein